jgi:hypothetical protein
VAVVDIGMIHGLSRMKLDAVRFHHTSQNGNLLLFKIFIFESAIVYMVYKFKTFVFLFLEFSI